MGRPRSFDRDVALDKAMRLFWTHGYEQTSIVDLTRELNISATSLYAAFGDKRTLFEEAVARYEASPNSVTTVGLAGTSRHAVLATMFDSAAREYTNVSHPRGCLVNSEPKLGDNRARNRAITATRLREVTDEPAPEEDAETLAAFAQVMLVGLSSYARDGATAEQLRRVAQLAARVTTA
jgi:AcrR family transcriptional regulator